MLTQEASRELHMMLDEMSAPLGQQRAGRRAGVPVSLSFFIRVGLAVLVLLFTAWAMLVHESRENEPNATKPAVARAADADTRSERLAKQAVSEEPVSRSEAAAIETPPPPAGRTVTIIDGTSGKRQEIVLPAPVEDATRADDRKPRSSLRPRPNAETRNP